MHHPQATVAVRLERAHAQFLGEGEGLAVVRGGLVDIRRLALCGDLAKEPQGVCLVPPSFVATGERQGLPGAGVCVIKTTGK